MSILAFGDEQIFQSVLEKAAINNGFQIEYAETAAVAGDWFDSLKPELLVLCFDSVAKSEAGIKALYAHSQLAPFTDFKTLLLCSKSEASTALKLCQDRVFNDYQIAKPLQDSAQLEWRLHSLMQESLSIAKASFNQIPSQLEKMQKILDFSCHEVSSSASQLNTTNRQKLSSIESQLRENIVSMMMAGVNSSTQHHDKELITASINDALDGFSGNIDEVFSSLAETVMAQYASLDLELNNVNKLVNHASKPVIMVVDDNAGFREPVVEMLLDEGYQVIISDSGDKAVSIILRQSPALVLIDYQMPGMNGLDTIKSVRELLNGARAPDFIMITGEGSLDVVEQAKAVGIDQFLVKPIRRKDLLEKVNNQLGMRSLAK